MRERAAEYMVAGVEVRTFTRSFRSFVCRDTAGKTQDAETHAQRAGTNHNLRDV